MKKRTIIALAIAIIPALGACGDTPTDVPAEIVLFSLASNGVTVLCPDAAVGDVESVDGVDYTKRDRNGIEDLVAASDYAPLATTCTSDVTDMSFLFESAFAFDEAIGSWDVSSVTSLEAISFDQPIDGWDVSNVTNMGWMFSTASAFNEDLSGWCAILIPSPPTSFDAGATSWVLPRPVWGTCP